MDPLTELFARMQTPEMIAEKQAKALRSSHQRQTIKSIPPDPIQAAIFRNAGYFDVEDPARLQEMTTAALKARYTPPTSLPCANVQAAKYSFCQNPGKMACSACKLVSYCSKVGRHLVARIFWLIFFVNTL